MKDILKSIYYIFIVSISLTLKTALIFGLYQYPYQSISDNMLTNSTYRIILSSTVVLQLATWTLCLSSKSEIDEDTVFWGYLVTSFLLCSWIGLTSILRGTEHVIFVSIFMACFLILMLIFCSLTINENVAIFLRVSVFVLAICAMTVTVLFNKKEFYLLEHISFLIYSLIFVLFFFIHPYWDWSVLPECMRAHDVPWEVRRQREYTHV